MRYLPYALAVIGMNAVPVWGWLTQGWNLGTTLALYWCETVLSGLLVGLRIWLHRRFTGKRGHRRGQLGATVTVNNRAPTPIGSFLSEFLISTLFFSAVQGVFLFVLLRLLIPKLTNGNSSINFADLQTGLLGISLFLVLDFLLDLGNIRHRPFSWIRATAQRALGRVFVVHLAILIGMPVMLWLDQPRALFVVFAILKTMSDLSAHIPQYDPKEAPTWLAKLLNKVGDAKPGDFEKYWRDEREKEQKQHADDELV